MKSLALVPVDVDAASLSPGLLARLDRLGEPVGQDVVELVPASSRATRIVLAALLGIVAVVSVVLFLSGLHAYRGRDPYAYDAPGEDRMILAGVFVGLTLVLVVSFAAMGALGQVLLGRTWLARRCYHARGGWQLLTTRSVRHVRWVTNRSSSSLVIAGRGGRVRFAELRLSTAIRKPLGSFVAEAERAGAHVTDYAVLELDLRPLRHDEQARVARRFRLSILIGTFVLPALAILTLVLLVLNLRDH